MDNKTKKAKTTKPAPGGSRKKSTRGKGKKKGKSSARILSLKIFIWVALLAVAAGGAFYCCRYFFSRIDNGRYRLPDADIIGIDISHYQHGIRWNELQFNYDIVSRELRHDSSAGKRKVDFIIAKATEGEEMADTHYRGFRGQAKRHKVTFGAYHYFKPNIPADKQARNFIRVADLLPGDIRPVLDVEEQGRLSATQLQDAVFEWMSIVEEEYGCEPILYCNLKYYSQYFTLAKFRKYPIWIASYSINPVYVNYVLWQQTDKGIVGGVDQKVDINVFNGNRKEFESLLIP